MHPLYCAMLMTHVMKFSILTCAFDLIAWTLNRCELVCFHSHCCYVMIRAFVVAQLRLYFA